MVAWTASWDTLYWVYWAFYDPYQGKWVSQCNGNNITTQPELVNANGVRVVSQDLAFSAIIFGMLLFMLAGGIQTLLIYNKHIF